MRGWSDLSPLPSPHEVERKYEEGNQRKWNECLLCVSSVSVCVCVFCLFAFAINISWHFCTHEGKNWKAAEQQTTKTNQRKKHNKRDESTHNPSTFMAKWFGGTNVFSNCYKHTHKHFFPAQTVDSDSEVIFFVRFCFIVDFSSL